MKTRNTRSADDAIRTPKSSTTREKVDIYSSLHHLQHKSTFGSTIKIEKGISSLSPSKPDKFNHLDRVDNVRYLSIIKSFNISSYSSVVSI